jgi:hypothetical protein
MAKTKEEKLKIEKIEDVETTMTVDPIETVEKIEEVEPIVEATKEETVHVPPTQDSSVESNHEEKSLNISDINGAKETISDIEVYGNGDTFALLCKASSKKQGWFKSTKVCNCVNGCLVQVTTQQKNLDGTYSVAEALTYVPDMKIDINAEPRKLVSIR